jgi:predicted lipoprotein
MKNTLLIVTMPLAFILFMTACSKNDNTTPQQQVSNQDILDNYVNGLVLPNLKDLNENATKLNSDIEAFIADKNTDNLTKARNSWYSTRISWEQSEAMLFGPVEDNNFDPRIDSWPVDFNAIQTVWNSQNDFTEDYINGLQDELKGFHPIEYILFGQNGDAKPEDFTDQRKVDYLAAMSNNLKKITDSLYNDWLPAGGNFAQNLLKAGTADSKYSTQQAAFIEIANAMIDIVKEVGDSKLKQPFDEKDPTQAESPFSKNSFTDFKNNITGARNVYLGGYGNSSGASLSNLVAVYNKSLDTRIQKQLDEIITNLESYNQDGITYSEAIVNNRPRVQASMDMLATLQNTLEDELIKLIQLHVK